MAYSLSVFLGFLFLLSVMVEGSVVPINSPEPEDGHEMPDRKVSFITGSKGSVVQPNSVTQVTGQRPNENGTSESTNVNQKPTSGLLCWETPLYEKCRCGGDESAGKCFLRGVLTIIVYGLAILAVVAIPCCCYKYHSSLCSVSTDLSKELLKEFRKTKFTKLPAPEMVKTFPNGSTLYHFNLNVAADDKTDVDLDKMCIQCSV